MFFDLEAYEKFRMDEEELALYEEEQKLKEDADKEKDGDKKEKKNKKDRKERGQGGCRDHRSGSGQCRVQGYAPDSQLVQSW